MWILRFHPSANREKVAIPVKIKGIRIMKKELGLVMISELKIEIISSLSLACEKNCIYRLCLAQPKEKTSAN